MLHVTVNDRYGIKVHPIFIKRFDFGFEGAKFVYSVTTHYLWFSMSFLFSCLHSILKQFIAVPGLMLVYVNIYSEVVLKY